MRRLWLLFLIAFYSGCSHAQHIDALKGLTYQTAATAHWTAEVHFTGDSLFFDKKRDADITDARHFAIAGQEVRGSYQLIYVKSDPAPFVRPKGTNYPAPVLYPHYTLIVFSLSGDRQQLFVLHLLKNYNSVEEIKAAYTGVPFNDMFFTTWYASALYSKFSAYPNLLNADKTTVQQVLTDCKVLIDQNKAKVKNGNGGLSVDPAFNLFSIALIAHHLNPAGIADLNSVMTSYHLEYLLSAR